MSKHEDSVQRKVNKDIFLKFLSWQSKKTSKHSYNSNTISRKLYLEEYKLCMQLQQIEKERKLFLHKNNNEKYRLQLTLKDHRRFDLRHNKGQQGIINDETRPRSWISDAATSKESKCILQIILVPKSHLVSHTF